MSAQWVHKFVEKVFQNIFSVGCIATALLPKATERGTFKMYVLQNLPCKLPPQTVQMFAKCMPYLTLLLRSFFGMLMLTFMVSPAFNARSSFSGGFSSSCAICSSTRIPNCDMR